MTTVFKSDGEYLIDACNEMVETLKQKREDWATGMGVFECFDAQRELGDDPLEFAIKMCNLKMVRLKSCVNRRHQKTTAPGLDRDLKDSIKDLAGYALLAFGLYKREMNKDPKLVSKPDSVDPTPLVPKRDWLLAQQVHNQLDPETVRRLNEVYYESQGKSPPSWNYPLDLEEEQIQELRKIVRKELEDLREEKARAECSL
jgi:hypothetical protein